MVATAPAFPFLALVQVGSYKLANRNLWDRLGFTSPGWIHVEKKDGETHLTWTNQKDTHNPLEGPAKILSVDPHGEPTAYYTTALDLHLRWMRESSRDDPNIRPEVYAFAHELQNQLSANPKPPNTPCQNS